MSQPSLIEFPVRSDKLKLSVSSAACLCSVKSEFQTIEIFETEVFGKVLLLDGHVQLATFDEAAYHESLVWIPLLNTADPRSALVVGGGDGGVLRELCKHPGLEYIDMVEIDQAVIEVSKKHLPELSAGAFDDPRVKLHIGDAFEFVKNASRTYDLIVVDCTDVYEEEEGELSEMLFTDTFYNDVLACLSIDGFVVTQADNLVFCPYSLEEIRSLFQRVFPTVGDYWGLVPSFGGFSGYVWGSKGRTVSVETTVPTGFTYLTQQLYSAAMSKLSFHT